MANRNDERFPTEKDGFLLPKHYTEHKYQVIEILEDTFTPEQTLGFKKFMICKYLSRADQNAKLEDYRKAQYYLHSAILSHPDKEKISEDRLRPNHYRGGKKIETIDWIEDQLSPEEFEGALLSIILKYVLRANHKNGVEDLMKAEYYMDKFIEKYSKRVEKENEIKEIKN